MTAFSIRELGLPPWADFVQLVEKHNAIWGGCWCVALHLKSDKSDERAGRHREYKEKLVRANQTHAVLVYDADHLVGVSSDPQLNFQAE